MNIVKNGRKLNFYNDIEILKELKVGVYSLDWDAFGNCFLIEESDFTFPGKIYDVEQAFREQVLNSFNKLNKNIGVLLDGYKGQGKSVTAKQLCIEAKVPVIIIKDKIPTHVDFTRFLQDIQVPFVLFIDEFEKIFSEGSRDEGKTHTQDVFLTFMDGAMSSGRKILFLLTTNNSVGDKFINRPSRIRFYKKYNIMPKEMFDMILEDKLDNKEFKKDLVDNMPLLDCTIDLLHTIIEEINITNKPYSHFKDIFNHKPRKITYSRYKLVGKEYEFYDMLEVDREITRETTTIGASYHCVVIGTDSEYLYYKTKEYVAAKPKNTLNLSEDEEDEEEDYMAEEGPKSRYKDVLYRIKVANAAAYAF